VTDTFGQRERPGTRAVYRRQKRFPAHRPSIPFKAGTLTRRYRRSAASSIPSAPAGHAAIFAGGE